MAQTVTSLNTLDDTFHPVEPLSVYLWDVHHNQSYNKKRVCASDCACVCVREREMEKKKGWGRGRRLKPPSKIARDRSISLKNTRET